MDRSYLYGVVFSVLLAAAPTMVNAQTETDTSDAYEVRNPTTALILSIAIPGGGHLYAGEKQTGITLLFTGVTSFMVSSQLSKDEGGREVSNVPLVIGGAILLGTWGYGIYDARAAAQRANRRHEDEVALRLTSMATPDGALVPGLAFRVRFN